LIETDRHDLYPALCLDHPSNPQIIVSASSHLPRYGFHHASPNDYRQGDFGHFENIRLVIFQICAYNNNSIVDYLADSL
jgi:hypothetical protein